jgi:hypothetical protein
MSLPLTGYVAPRLDALRAALRTDVWAQLGASINLDEGSVLGNLIDLFAARLDELAEATQGVYDSFDERAATGTYLDNIADLVGVYRLEASYSTVTLRLTAAAGPAVTVPAGTVAKDGSTGTEWITAAACVVPGAGTNTVEASPALTGPTTAGAGTITTIVTPVAGWTAVTNLAAAVPGTDRETDEELRARRRESLQLAGSASVNAIRSAVRALAGVSACLIVDNKTDYPTTVSSVVLPPHSFLAVVYPAPGVVLKQDIAEAIWANNPAGIWSCDGTAGGLTLETATILDVEGQSQTVRFNVAGGAHQHIQITITVDLAAYGGAPGSGGAGDLALKAALIAMVDSLPLGTAPLALDCYRVADAIPGVENVTVLAFAGSVSPGTFLKATLIAGDIAIT